MGRGTRLGPSYRRYIQSERWKLKCKQYWDAKGRWCRGCLAKTDLVVHHLSYKYFEHEPLSDLIGLCHTCHREVHRIHRAGGRAESIRNVTARYIRQRAQSRMMRRKTT